MTDSPATFVRVARASTLRVGLTEAQRRDAEAELLEHLLTARDEGIAVGLSVEEAEGVAVARFGDVRTTRRAFQVRRIVTDLRRSARLPRHWALALLVDALAPLIATGASPELWAVRAAVPAITYLLIAVGTTWTGIAGCRFGATLCHLGLAGRVARSEGVAGAGLIFGAIGLMLYLGPGVVLPAVCDLIERVAGVDTPVAAFILGGGVTAALLGLTHSLFARRIVRDAVPGTT